MTVPLVPGKDRFEAIVTPAEMLAHRRRGGRLGDVPAPIGAVVCLQRGLPERLRRRIRLRPLGRLMGELYAVRSTAGRVVVLTGFGLGAPIVAAQVEELIALGARSVVSVALAGGIRPGLAAGSIVLADSALRDEGTSHHYLAPAGHIDADLELVASLGAGLDRASLPYVRGRTWSTDAPYRETREEVARHQADGVLVVDMEMAALFAVAQTRGVAAGGLLVVGDSLADGTWRPPDRLDVMERALERAYAVAIGVLDAR
jgi:uridine phosphorylase